MQERGPVAALSRRAEPSRSITARGGKPRRLGTTILVGGAVLVVDQVTKSLALSGLRHRVHLLGPLGLGLTFNRGAAFSLFAGSTGVVVVVAVVLVGVLGVLAWRRSAGFQAAVGLVLGGAISNLADRAFRSHHGAVVDFITLSHWPTFNVADACITVGVIVAVVLSLSPRWRGAHLPAQR
ncbi:MAG: signal peptidase II [Acidimicrobiales bacterium]